MMLFGVARLPTIVRMSCQSSEVLVSSFQKFRIRKIGGNIVACLQRHKATMFTSTIAVQHFTGSKTNTAVSGDRVSNMSSVMVMNTCLWLASGLQ